MAEVDLMREAVRDIYREVMSAGPGSARKGRARMEARIALLTQHFTECFNAGFDTGYAAAKRELEETTP